MKKYDLLPHQVRCVEYGIKNPYFICAVSPGGGKAQKLSSVVYAPEGKKVLSQLKVGDKILNPSGGFSEVLGIYPQGIKKIFRVTFSDGSQTDCCEDHLWSTRTSSQKKQGKQFKVTPLKEISGELSKRYSIPICKPVNFSEKEIITHPYLLGVLIGDGCLKESVTITNSSDFIFEKIKTVVPNTISVKKSIQKNTYKISLLTTARPKNILREEIKRLSLDCLSKNKRIPTEYLYNTVENRIALLQGLMDTDGYIDSRGKTEFTSASKGLVQDVVELVQSLGGISTIRHKRSKCQTGEFDSWTTDINLPKEITPVTLPRKLERYKPSEKYLPNRIFEKVEFVGEEEAMCISVEGEHYLTDEFIVTHNTVISLEIADRLKAKMLVICPSYLIPNWKREIEKFFGNTKQVSVVRNAKQVYALWDTDICLASYEFANSYDPLFEWADLVVFEEGHYLKNIKAKRTEACHRLLYQYSNKRMIILTGTPIKNRVQEFYSLLTLCYYNPRLKDPDFLKKFPEEISFAEKYSFKTESRISIFSAARNRMIEVPLIKFTGIQNVEELKGWLKGIYIRVKDTEFMKTDGFIYKDFICGAEGDGELYDAFIEFMEENQGIAPKLKVKSALEKVPFTIKYVKDLLEEVDQVVVYSDHVEPCEKIAEAFGVQGITGSMSVDQRMKIADQFFRKEIKVIVATIGSFSTGINNLVVANNMVFNDVCWTPGDLQQAIKRIDRIGQTKQCIIHRMMGTVQDEKIYEALDDKMKTIGKII